MSAQKPMMIEIDLPTLSPWFTSGDLAVREGAGRGAQMTTSEWAPRGKG